MRYNRGMEHPFGIENFPDLPLKLRTMILKEWNKRDHDVKSPGRPSKYPWDEWMNGRIHRALAGRDFHMSVDKFRSALRQKAYHTGMSVASWVEEVRENGPTGPVQFWVNFRFVPKGQSGGNHLRSLDDRIRGDTFRDSLDIDSMIHRPHVD